MSVAVTFRLHCVTVAVTDIAMNRENLIEQLDEILALLAAQANGGRGGLSEQRRKLILRLVKALRTEIAKSTD